MLWTQSVDLNWTILCSEKKKEKCNDPSIILLSLNDYATIQITDIIEMRSK